jgi:hypothetical protein
MMRNRAQRCIDDLPVLPSLGQHKLFVVDIILRHFWLSQPCLVCCAFQTLCIVSHHHGDCRR